jgi:CubicO group peptidase (beta-lactamase class C family)
MKRTGVILFVLLSVMTAGAQPLQRVAPEAVGLDASRLANADAAIMKAIQEKDIPGAVLAVVRHGKMAYLKAYGNKQIYPTTVAMTTNTVFDMASCSKCMSTAICAMILIERGQLRLLDRVGVYIPGFEDWKDAKGEKQSIRIVDLMTHTSGLPPYAPVDSLKKKYGAPNRDGVIDYISHCKRDFRPETDFQYSCLNFITLQRVIETISGMNLREFAKKNVFDVLGMTHTDYCPNAELKKLCAPATKQPDGSVLQGIVHDPLARVMNGGISGNAGVFSSADDIAVLAAALQNGGQWNGHRILSPMGVKAMRTVPRCVSTLGRALGWDVFSDYASNIGDIFGPNTYGHTGYTGTSIVIDPDSDTSVILLTNRVHPDDGGACVRLRSLVANAVAAAVIPSSNTQPKRK